MKHIKKGQEPHSLWEYRTTTPNPNFDDINKEDVRKTLLGEQGFICAYCMQRISNQRVIQLNKYRTEIEHFRSQHRHPDLTLDYKNMLGVCNGNAERPTHKLICDKAKSKYDKTNDLTVDPQKINRIKQLMYTKEGEIFSSIETVNNDLNKILNLNEQSLKEKRQTVYINMRRKIRSFWESTLGNKAKVRLAQ